MRFLGIDYGTKRIGLSFGDELGIALPLPAAVSSSEKERLERIRQVIMDRRIDEVVVGYPYNMDGSAGFKAREVDAFIRRLQQVFDGPIHRADERLTSVDARQRLQKGKGSPSRKSGEIDSAAAALILQDYLDTRYPAGVPKSGEGD